jgi:hypothetical protein
MGLSYPNNRQFQPSESRQRLNSNRSNNNRNEKRLTSTTGSHSSYEISTAPSGRLIREIEHQYLNSFVCVI